MFHPATRSRVASPCTSFSKGSKSRSSLSSSSSKGWHQSNGNFMRAFTTSFGYGASVPRRSHLGASHGVYGWKRSIERNGVLLPSSLPLQQRFFGTLPPHTLVGLPALSPTMEIGNLAKWKKKEGDKIKAGDVLAEIETDKATLDFEVADDMGYLAKIVIPEGTQNIAVGKTIAITVEDKANVAAFKDYQVEEAAEAKPAQPAQPAQPVPPPQPAASAPPQPAAPSVPTPSAPAPSIQDVVPGAPPPPRPLTGPIASPAAKAVAAQQGVNLGNLQGTGPSGRILKSDVLEAAVTLGPAPVAAAPGALYTDIPTSQIRRVIADRLTKSKQNTPHYYLTIDCNVDKLMNLRARLNESAKGEFKLSVNDFVIKASALACLKVPEANSAWMDQSIRRFHTVDINVAVNTERGLLTPLVKNADKLGLAAINNAVKVLAEKAKLGKLTPEELASGTFTISNLGMFGIKQFTAVILPPQACILAVGATDKRVVVNENNKENPFSTANIMTVTLSSDHRVVDGAIGAQWLAKFRELIEDPVKMLL